MNYYRRYVGDYLRDTSHLSMLEHGAYTLMLDHYYGAESPLPLSVSDIYRICRAIRPDEQAAVRRVLAAFFTEVPDGFHNPRADDELSKGRKAIEGMSEGGKAGAMKRWKAAKEDRAPYGVPHKHPNVEGINHPNGDAYGVSMHPPTSNLQPPTKAERHERHRRVREQVPLGKTSNVASRGKP